MFRNTRKQIIVVDDVNFTLISTVSRLEKHYDVFPADSAEMMFEILERTLPDLILLDINMPGVDGFEAIKKLKESRLYSRCPVIFLTGNTDRESIIRGMKLGAADFITKPFSDIKLIECIEFQLNSSLREKNKPVVLAVDDNPSTLTALSAILEKQFTVYTLPEPQKIKLLLDMIEPDLFILDYNMPVLSGFDLVPIIREMPVHKDTPVVFLTSEGTVDNLTVAINLDVSDFLIKPIDEAKLREKITKHTANYIIRRRLRAL